LKHKHSKLQKFLLLFLIIFGVGASGITGYALVTGNMPPILNMFSSGIFSSGSGANALKQGEMQLESESSTSINPQEITPTDSTAVSSNSASSIDPDAKIDENQLSPQGDTSIAPQPISVTTSQNPTSTSSNSASSKPSGTALKPASPVSSSPESAVSSEPVSSAPDSSPSDHHTAPRISGVNLDKTQMTLNKGDISVVLTPTITPSNASGDKNIKWTTGNANIATVNNIGHITAVGGGTVTITATTSNGKTAACTVTVLVPASTIKINSEAFSIDKGSSKTLTATVGPEDATDKTVIWATSNNDVVSVDAVGKIKAEKAGTATITATTSDGKFSTKCAVTVGISISSLTLNKTKTTLIKNTEETLTATIDPPDTTENLTVKWTSSNTSVAAVDSNGKVTALARGETTITAQAGSHCAECIVTVIVPANGISLNKPSATLAKGTEETLTATIFPEDSTDKAVEWTSSDESIATVDMSGKITAVNVGTAIITAKSHSGGFTDTCTVNVVIPVTGIAIDKAEIILIKGSTESLTATITPSDATDKAVAWTSSDTNIATIGADGKITAVAGGTATIKVTTHDGNFLAECKVTVIVPVTGISLNKTTSTLVRGTEDTLMATILPGDATNKTVLWATSNSDVCTVDNNGKVTAVNAGTTVITATSEDGGFVAQCTVTAVVLVTGVSLNKESLTLVKGTNETLNATITPADATDKAVAWSSSDPSIATVDVTGKVTAIAGGSTTITATTHEGNFTGECKVSVIVPVTGISLNKTTTTIPKGTNETLTPTITPEDATDKSVVWTSSNNSFATVDSTGKVTAVSVGTAVITVKSHDGGFTAECTVKVVIHVAGVSLNKANLTLVKGTNEILISTITPEDATDKSVVWTSSNEVVATVDSTGKVTAIGAGIATISITTHDGGFKAQCSVTVVIPVTGISLNQSSLIKAKGSTNTLMATVSPNDATDKRVLWSSSNNNVATVDNAGNVTVIGKGQAVVKAVTYDGSYVAQCSVSGAVCTATVGNKRGYVKGITDDGRFDLACDLEAGVKERQTDWMAVTLNFDEPFSYTDKSLISMFGIKGYYKGSVCKLSIIIDDKTVCEESINGSLRDDTGYDINIGSHKSGTVTNKIVIVLEFEGYSTKNEDANSMFRSYRTASVCGVPLTAVEILP
jgi:uncharacterized protein YjdB